MKLKNFLFLLAIAVVFAITACGDDDGSTSTPTPVPQPTSQPTDPNAGKLFTSDSGIAMSWIPAVESFSVGSGTVKLTGFHMGKYEVTQEQYQAVMGVNPSHFHGGTDREPDTGEEQGKRPVEMVTWFDAIEFCNKLSEQEGLQPVYMITGRTPSTGYPITAATVEADFTKNGYRLPTEVQWQYAAQAGSATEVIITEATGWYNVNSNSKTHQVGLKAANAWNLYDMLGNVWELCWDWYGETYPSGAENPLGSSSGTNRMQRGGSWSFWAEDASSTSRFFGNPSYMIHDRGFRLVRP